MRNKLLLIALLLGIAVPGYAIDYYVGPSGSGTTCSMGSPCTLAQALSVAVAGDTIHMANGTYTGCNSMLDPPAGKNGSPGSPITVRATNDGEVLINSTGLTWHVSCGGAFESAIHLENNDWWIIEGVNATANQGGNADVVEVGSGADNNIIRRVVAWDADNTSNSAVFWNYAFGSNNLFEDIAAFGTGRKMIANGQSGDSHLTVRRAFAFWMGPALCVPTCMGGSTVENSYSSYHGLYENIIAAGDVDPASDEGFSGLLQDGHFDPTCGGACTSAQICANSAYYGSIGYSLASQDVNLVLNPVLDASQYIDCRKWQDVVAYAEAGRDIVIMRDVQNGSGYPGPSGPQLYTNVTEIGTGSSFIGGSWTVTNRANGATVGAVPNIWNGVGTSGARVCYRYVNGALTATPLWPWPMNQRIIDAMTTAGRTPVNVTTTMEGLFGTIPAECRTDVSVPPGTITVFNPTSGTVCVAGAACSISWTTAGITGDVVLSYRLNGLNFPIATVAYNSSPYLWTVDAPAGMAFTWRVSQGAIFDDGDEFTIRSTKAVFKQ